MSILIHVPKTCTGYFTQRRIKSRTHPLQRLPIARWQSHHCDISWLIVYSCRTHQYNINASSNFITFWLHCSTHWNRSSVDLLTRWQLARWPDEEVTQGYFQREKQTMVKIKQTIMTSPNANPKTNQEICVAASATVFLTAIQSFSCFYGRGFY